LSEGKERESGEGFKLDVVVSASGFGRKEARILEEYMEAIKEGSSEEEDGEEEEKEDEREDERGTPSVREDDRGSLSVREDDRGPPSVREEEDEREPPGVVWDDVDRLSPSVHGRELSRSPPQSRSPSPSSLAKMTAALNLTSGRHGIKDIVGSELTKQRARQREKYHSKGGVRRIGRARGSKGKEDNRVKVDKRGIWE